MLCPSSDCSARSHGLVDFLRAEQVELVSSGLALGEGDLFRGLRLYCRASAFPSCHCPSLLLAPRLSQACSLPTLHFTMDPTSGVPGLRYPGRTCVLIKYPL